MRTLLEATAKLGPLDNKHVSSEQEWWEDKFPTDLDLFIWTEPDVALLNNYFQESENSLTPEFFNNPFSH